MSLVIKGMVLLPLIGAAIAVAQAASSSPAKDIPSKYLLGAPAPNSVVATVNGVDIKMSDVEPLLWEWMGFDAIQELITYQLVKDEAQKMRISISEQEVEGNYDQQVKAITQSLPPDKSLDIALLERDATRSRLYLRAKTYTYLNAIVLRAYKPQDLVKISTIVIKPANEQATSLQDALKRANEAYDRLKKGDRWEDVLRSTTTQPEVIKAKGLVGWRELAAFPQTVRDELQHLKPGEITKPAGTNFGIQIFRLEENGANATPEEQATMKTSFINGHVGIELQKIRQNANVNRLYPPIQGINTQKGGN